MVKKLLLILSVLTMLFGSSSKAMAEKWVEVTTPQEFSDAVTKNHSANIKLLNNIDMSKLNADGDYYFNFTFTGKISGTQTKAEDVFNYGFYNAKATLFRTLDKADIREIFAYNCSFDGRDTSSGWFADDTNESTFDNIMLVGVNAVGDKNSYDCDCMGAVTGKAVNSTFSNLSFFDCELMTDGQELGLVAGEAKNCKINGCVTNSYCNLWADGSSVAGVNAYAYVGGIFGYAESCQLEKCFNFGIVSSDDDRIGGIIGYGKATTLTDCRNGGVVMNMTKEGFGREKRQAVADVAAYVSISAGIAGTIMTGILSSSTVKNYFDKLYHANYMDGNADDPSTNWDYFYETIESLLDAYQGDGGIDAGQFDPGYAKNTVRKIIKGVTTAIYVSPHVCAAVASASAIVYISLSGYNVITQPDEMGGIAGTIVDGSKVLRCMNMGPVSCADSDCGGIVGHLEDSSIESCLNSCFVRGGYSMLTGSCIGGIVGYCKNGTINSNLCTGAVTANTSRIGNIEGKIAGTYNGKNNYFLAEENADFGTAAHSFTQEKLPSGEIAMALNSALSTPVWRQNLGKDFYPTLNDTTRAIVTKTTADYTLVQKVYTAGDLYSALANPKAHISLQNDINLSNQFFLCSTKTYPFQGTIDGNGHSITNISYQSSCRSEESSFNKAFLPYATGATFNNLVINNFNITQKDERMGKVNTQALFVGISNNCKYNSITIRNSSIKLNADNDYKSIVAALIAISNNDQITDCTIEATCELQGHSGVGSYDTNVGGLVAKAYGTTFTRCHNAAKVSADDNNEGGILAYGENCSIISCLNSGYIVGQKYVGGIAGRVVNTKINQCVNVGTVDDDESKKESYRAGIVAYMEKGGSITDCLNFGEVKYPGSESGAIDGHRDEGVTYGYRNFYHCQYDGESFTNMSNDLYSQMLSGEYAHNLDWLYQSIDNASFCTNLPVPVPAAGKVYLNCLCDNACSVNYSNYYHAADGHKTAEYAGICTLCGRHITASQSIKITNAEELVAFAHAVNSGVDFSRTNVNIMNDIDMKGVQGFVPIGIDKDHPFCGTVVGNGAVRIKNLKFNRTNGQEGAALFGCVSGTTYIYNVIIDSSCSISSNGRGAAGLVGLVTADKNAATGSSLHLVFCGNEANITSTQCNAAGLVGGVYYNKKNSLVIDDCYNTGNIIAPKESAALVAYGNKDCTVRRCWNTGKVYGCDKGHSLVRYDTKTTQTDFSDLYQLKGCPLDENAKVRTLQDFAYGAVCNDLNEAGTRSYPVSAWGQNLGTEKVPQLSRDGIRHERSTTSTGWDTAVLPYAVKSDENVQLYKVVKVENIVGYGKIFVEPVDEVEANVPFIFKNLNADATSVCFSKGNNSFTLTDDDPESIVAETSADGCSLVGTYDSFGGLLGGLYLAKDKFLLADKAVTVQGYRAYLTYLDPLTSSTACELTISIPGSNLHELVDDTIDEDGSGKTDENVKTSDMTNNIKSDICGRRISSTVNGVTINGGKKIFKR